MARCAVASTFVLLLTFIRLVIALSKPSHGTGASASDMTQLLPELLKATSIARLFSSIVLSIFVRSSQASASVDRSRAADGVERSRL
jgi:hypothetical protein